MICVYFLFTDQNVDILATEGRAGLSFHDVSEGPRVFGFGGKRPKPRGFSGFYSLLVTWFVVVFSVFNSGF